MIGKNARLIAATCLLALAVPAYAGSVNKSVKIEPGTTADGASSVNGSVTVGEGATVTGDVETVNGTIRVRSTAIVEDVSTVNGSVKIADNVQADSLSTVNGSVSVGAGSSIRRNMEAVNGRLSVENGATIGGSVENVNGEVDIDGASIEKDISTVNGDIQLKNGAHVMGDIIVNKPSGWGWNNNKKRKPKIILGRNARVDGTIVAEREVEIYMHETAELGGVSGKASMEDVVRFSGNRPSTRCCAERSIAINPFQGSREARR